MTSRFNLKWGAIGLALLAAGWGLLSDNAIDIYDRFTQNHEHAALVEDIERFQSESYIVSVKSDTDGTYITYYTCKAPDADYTIAISVNGEIKVAKEFTASLFPEKYTNECFQWTPQTPHGFQLESGDQLVVVWDYGEHGRFEMTWEV